MKGEKTLYFFIRSWIMGFIANILFLSAVGILGSINLIQTIVMGGFFSLIALCGSKLFDPQITRASKKILKFLDRHERLEKFILKYF